jgi:hypothetical protein
MTSQKVYIKEQKTKLNYCTCLLPENGYIIFVEIRLEEITSAQLTENRIPPSAGPILIPKPTNVSRIPCKQKYQQ